MAWTEERISPLWADERFDEKDSTSSFTNIRFDLVTEKFTSGWAEESEPEEG